MDQITTDSFLCGRLKISQTRKGYRFSVDAVIVAESLKPQAGDSILDLGTGCGIISILLAFRNPDITITAVEVQPTLAHLAQKNVHDNGLQERITILEEDMRKLVLPEASTGYNAIICNPPYRRKLSGRINPNSEKALARHEISVNLAQLMGVARKMLITGGRFVTIYPAERLIDLVEHMRTSGFEPKWLRCVHSRFGDKAKLVLVHGVKGARPGLIFDPPLYVYQQNGQYTAEIEAMLSP